MSDLLERNDLISLVPNGEKVSKKAAQLCGNEGKRK